MYELMIIKLDPVVEKSTVFTINGLCNGNLRRYLLLPLYSKHKFLPLMKIMTCLLPREKDKQR